MAITKKIRFEVFKRDGFTCQYCGNHPPEIILEVDHIHPVSKGGSDDINNLIASCFDCNRGKTNIELKKIPNSLSENKEILEEKEQQYLEYNKLLKKINKRMDKEIDQVEGVFREWFPNRILLDNFKKLSLKKFISKLGVFSVCDAMNLACLVIKKKKDRYNMHLSDDTIKYFCGICWNKIREGNNEN
jgi:hypothetical protein